MSRRVPSLVLLLCVWAVTATTASAEWLCDWDYRRPVTVTEQSGGALTDYQIRLDVTYVPAMNADFSDLRFTLDDGATEIDYWIEQYAASSSAIVWIEVPSLPASSSETIYMYYGNASVATTSDGAATFVFFDGFETWTGWSDYGPGGVAQNTAAFGFPTLHKQGNNDPNGGWKPMGATVTDFRLLAREQRRTESGGGAWSRYGLEDGSFNGYTIRRNGNVTGAAAFGFERRTGGAGAGFQSVTLSQPRDNWYITELTRYGSGASNLTATLYDDGHAVIGAVTGTDGTHGSFSRMTVRGGWPYYLDWVAVASFVPSEPATSVGPEESGGCYSITGVVFEDIAGEALAGGQVVSDAGNPVVAGVSVSLYRDGGDGTPDGADDVLDDADTTNLAGAYTFGVEDGETYWVVVDSKTLPPTSPLNGGYAQGDVWSEQTYGPTGALASDGSWGTYERASAGPCFGGRRGGVSDDASSLGGAEHVARIAVSGSDVTGLDFGFSFNVVADVRDGDDDFGAGRLSQGCLNQFVQNANAVSGSNAMRFAPAVPTNSSGGGGNWWTVTLTSALPPLSDDATTVDGTAYDLTDGVKLLDTNPGTIGHGGQPVGTGPDGIEASGDEPILPDYDRPELEIGGGDFGDVLEIAGNGQTVQAVALFDSDADDGVSVTSGTGSEIRGCVLGARADGTDPGAGARLMYGVLVSGGAADVTGNYVAHTEGSGAMILNASVVSGNDVFSVGLTSTYADGITVEGSVGQPIAVRGNRAESVAAYGLESWQAPGPYAFEDNTIRNTGLLGGGGENGGIRVFGTGNTVRGNIVSGAGGPGIVVVRGTSGPSTANTISRNVTYSNGSVGIDLDQTNLGGNPNGDGVSANDGALAPGDQNDGMDYPIFTIAAVAGTNLHVDGYVGVSASPIAGVHTVELFVGDDDGNNNGGWNSGTD